MERRKAQGVECGNVHLRARGRRGRASLQATRVARSALGPSRPASAAPEFPSPLLGHARWAGEGRGASKSWIGCGVSFRNGLED